MGVINWLPVPLPYHATGNLCLRQPHPTASNDEEPGLKYTGSSPCIHCKVQKQPTCFCPVFSVQYNTDATVFVARRFLGSPMSTELQSYLTLLPHWPSAVGSPYPTVSQMEQEPTVTRGLLANYFT